MPTPCFTNVLHAPRMPAPLRTDLDRFLFASVADDANGFPMTMLTALARTGVDPWTEAADLAGLSHDSAVQKLAAFLAGVPNGPAPGADTATLAARLISLLHRSPASTGSAVREMPPSDEATARRRRVDLAIYSAIALVCLLLGSWAFS